MTSILDPVRFRLDALSSWLNEHLPHLMDYLVEENLVGGGRLPFRMISDVGCQRGTVS